VAKDVKHELLPAGVSARYVIRYPSGARLELEGVFCVMGGGAIGGVVPAIKGALRGPSDLVVLDPRAIISRNEGVIIYSPRASRQLPTWAADWLVEHPEWPPADDVSRGEG
jgi:hypothetical protein